MNPAVFFVGLVVLVGAGLFAGRRAFAASPAEPGAEDYPLTLDEIYAKWGAQFGVDARLLRAIAQTESSENPGAVNAADNESIGLMQVLCRPDGAGGCTNKLNVEGWTEATRDRLLDPEFNVYIGAQIIAWNIGQFGVQKGIATYNAWDQRSAPAAGPFKNQVYVNKVLKKARALGYELPA